MMILYDLMWYFTIYAFLGWVAEVAAHAVTKGKFVNRGFLNGPVCPIYGFGVIAVLVMLDPIAHNIFLLYIGSVLVTSGLEFITGFVLEKIFHTHWWDYSKEKFNIMGYVSLRYSLLWGAACVFIVKVFQPSIAWLVAKIPLTAGLVIMSIIMCGFLVDFITMVVTLAKLKRNFVLAEKISSQIHEISDTIGGNIADEMLDLQEALNKAEQKKIRLQKRLLEAYPRLEKLESSNLFENIKSEIKKHL